MVRYEQKRVAGVSNERWMRIGTTSALIGGGLLALIGVALHSVLNEAQFAVVDPLGVIAMILLALGLPALYARERRWFGTLAKVGFGMMAAGWIVAAVALPVAVYGPGIAFLGFLLGLLVAMVGALVFGVSALRSDASELPRLGAWLLVAALPVGLPVTVAFTGYVMGEFADPWAGPMLLYGLAWIVFSHHLRTYQADAANVEAVLQ
ncbi:hypothetical protein [Halalkalicoccus salilacus]|uniref:hypothetical protein n=1 Tax=Halalkalicoccus salilacus TaxID=3117459 RepID=UPI00300E9CA1